jgi:hypothetical protein
LFVYYRDVLDGKYVSSLKKQELPYADDAVIGYPPNTATTFTLHSLLASVILGITVALLH